MEAGIEKRSIRKNVRVDDENWELKLRREGGVAESHLTDRLKNYKFNDNDFHEWRATRDTRHYNFLVFDYSTTFSSLFSINRCIPGRSHNFQTEQKIRGTRAQDRVRGTIDTMVMGRYSNCQIHVNSQLCYFHARHWKCL